MSDGGACFHGGSFWEALGPRFDRLDGPDRPINADVLDAWFPPEEMRAITDFIGKGIRALR